MSDLASLRAQVLSAILAVVASASAVAQTHSATRASGFEYDAKGMLSAEVVEPASPDHCVRTSYELDAYGNRTSKTQSACPGASPLAQFATRSSVVAFDAHTVVVAGATMQIPAGAFATSSTNALGHTEIRQFDPRFGKMISSTGPNGLTTSWQYDDLGRKVLEIGADGNRTFLRYCVLAGQGDTSGNSAGCLTSPPHKPDYAVHYVESQPQDGAGTPIGPYIRKYFDALDREIREVTQGYDGAGQPANARLIAKDTEYNAYGAVAKVTQPYFIDSAARSSVAGSSIAGGWTATNYDALGRPVVVYVRDDEGSQSALGQAVAVKAFAYNGANVTETSWRTSKNGEGQQQPADELKVTRTLDPLGRTVQVTDALGSTLRKRYDAFDNLVETQDSLDNRVRIVFDVRGRRTDIADPNSGAWTYRYNALGELIGQQNPSQRGASQWTTMEYDLLGRLKLRVEPGDYTTAWTYDTCTKGVGKVCHIGTDHGLTRSFTYDSLGRPSSSTQAVAGRGSIYTSATTYDAAGRPETHSYPTGMVLTRVYTPLGFPSEVRLGSESIWRMGSASAWAKPQAFEIGAGSAQATNVAYDPATGRTTEISAGAEGSIMGQTYGWDTVGNQTDRTDRYDGGLVALSENFGYDELNRLYRYETSSPTLPGLSKTVVLTYNAIGNVLEKSDVGVYEYPASGASSVRPSAVISVDGTSINDRTYNYDPGGNLISSSGSQFSTVTYTSFNLPRTLSGSNNSYAWAYGEDHQRIRETKVSLAGTRVTWYLHPDNAGGLAFEQEALNSGSPVNRHYVEAMGRTVAVVETVGDIGTAGATTPLHSQYWHVDQLGSITAIASSDGVVTQRYSYDPFGKRRELNGAYDGSGQLIFEHIAGISTDRGFTGHEHLDDVGIVHMNGRTYDPIVGRFMQPDPLIQFEDHAQSFNRYSYVLNNPLNATDPTGHFVQFFPAVMAFVGSNVAAGAMGVTFAKMTIAQAIIAGAVGGALATAVQGGDILRGAAIGGFSAGVFHHVGTALSDAGIEGSISPGENFGGWLAKTTSHATAGCVVGVVGGSGCKGGAIGAAASAGLGFAADEIGGGDATQTLVRASIGGAAASLAGEKFANGAVSAAMGYLFNTLAHWQIKKLYKPARGHHPYTQEMAKEFAEVMTDEAQNYVSQRTLGPNIHWDKGHPNRFVPETGHIQYNKDALAIGRKFIADEGITKANPMTAAQAARLESQLLRHEFNRKVQEYVNHQTKAGRVKLRGISRGGWRGSNE